MQAEVLAAFKSGVHIPGGEVIFPILLVIIAALVILRLVRR